jgi:hypothetical protein
MKQQMPSRNLDYPSMKDLSDHELRKLFKKLKDKQQSLTVFENSLKNAVYEEMVNRGFFAI